MPISKEAQRAEGEAREKAGILPGEAAHALDVIDDGAVNVDLPAPRTEGEADAPRPLPPIRSKNDDMRSAIVAKFRVDRTQAAAENTDEISDFTRSGMPADFIEPPVPVVDQVVDQGDAADLGAADEADAADAPQLPAKVKIKVRGQEMEVTLDELIAKGQIAYAADNYLDEAKGKLTEVDALIRQTRERAAPRAGQDGEHQTAPNRAQTTEPGETGDQAPQQPEDDLGKLIESIQFGDPEEAKVLLRNTIAGEARTVVSQTLEQQRFQDEGARTAKVLRDFEDQNPDIAKDKKARAAIEADILDYQVEDIKALGIDPATLRPDGLPPTPGDIANAHRWYRTKGFKVTAPAEMLEKATASFLEWRGVKTATPTPADPGNKAQPRVDVTVDRTARRAAIPQQPNRTAAPRPAPSQQQAAQPRNRASIVQDMIAKRGMPRGRILGTG